MIRYAVAFCFLLLLLGGCKKRGEPVTGPPAVVPPPSAETKRDPVSRGSEIFSNLDYSSTVLTCAHCHSPAASGEAGHLFVAHSAYGMSARGTWWIVTAQQFAAKQGEAKTLVDAANRCIKAPYMNGEKVLEGEEAEALEEYLKSIADPQAKDGKPFLIQRASSLPVGGLTPETENGKRIYESSCLHCHGKMAHIPNLEGIGDNLSPTQVMAKVRGLADWEGGFAGKTYARNLPPAAAALLNLVGVMPARAQEQPPVSGAGAGAVSGGPKISQAFPENAMPWYALDILSDQDVVDVAFYVAKELKTPQSSEDGSASSPGDGGAK